MNGFAYPQDESAKAEKWTNLQVILYRAYVVIPSAVAFTYAHEKGAAVEAKAKTKVELRISATLYNPDMKAFFGKTSTPNKVQLVPKSTNYEKYGTSEDRVFEFYFFAERVSSQAPLQMMIDLHL